jgi:hypothetical protein
MSEKKETSPSFCSYERGWLLAFESFGNYFSFGQEEACLSVREYIGRLADKYELSYRDREFLEVSLRLDYLCPLSALISHLKKPASSFYRLVADGLMESVIEKGRILISAEDAAKLMAFSDLWVSITEAAKFLSLSSKTLRNWILKGYLGPFIYDFRGRLLIKKETLPFLKEEKEALKKIIFQASHPSRCYLRPGEVGAADVAEALEIPRSLVFRWLKDGILKGSKRGRYWVISEPPEVVELVRRKKVVRSNCCTGLADF